MSSERKHSLLKEAYDMYYEELFNMSFLLTLNEDCAQSMVTEGYYRLYQKLKNGITGDNNIRSFLYTTIRDLSLNHLKYGNTSKS